MDCISSRIYSGFISRYQLGKLSYLSLLVVALSPDSGQFVFNPFISVKIVIKKFHDHSIRFCIAGESVGLVCIYMHGEVIIPVDSHNDICIDQSAAVAFGEDKDFVIIFDMKGKCVFRGHMDVAFGYNDSFGNFDVFARTGEDTAGGVFNISGLADNAGDTEFPDICQGKFYLGFFTKWSEKSHVLENSFGPFDSDSLLTEILTGLAQFSDKMRPAAFSE